MRKFICASILIGIFSVISLSLSAQLTFNVQSSTVNCESTGLVPVEITVENFNNIGNMQFGITWDTSVLEFVSPPSHQLPPSPLFIEDSTSIGQLRFGWADFNPPFTGESLPNGTPIITLFFNKVGNGGQTSPIDLTSVPGLNFQIADGGGVIIPVNQITVNNGSVAIFDNVNPTIQNCPSDQTVNIGTSQTTGAATWTAPTASDNCAVESFNSNFNSGDSFPVGTTTVTYTAEDFGGNTETCSFDVTVNQTSNPSAVRFELEMVSLDCAEDSVVFDLKVFNFNNKSSFQFGLEWDTSIVKYRDHQNFLPPAATFFENHPDSTNIGIRWADFSFPIGETIADNTTIISLVFDVEGLGGDSTLVRFVNLPSFPIEVTENSVPLPSSDYVLEDGWIKLSDTQAPSLTCPADVTVNVPSGATQGVATWMAPNISDNCHVASTMSNFNSGDSFPIGTTAVNYTATDNAGNSNSCSFNVTVTSNPAAGLPTFILEQEDIECEPDSVIVDLIVADFDNLSSFQFNVAWDTSVIKYKDHLNFLPPAATFFENHPDSANIGIRWADFSFPIGETLPDSMVIVSLVFDVVGGINVMSPVQFASGPGFPIEVTQNSVPLTADKYNLIDGGVNVSDNEAPVIIDCPVDFTVTAPLGSSSITVNWTAPTASDNCDLVSFSSNLSPNDTFNLGTTLVQYDAIDGGGNTDDCQFNVTVVEDMNPQPEFTSCPMEVNLAVDSLQCTVAHTWTPPTLNSTAGLDSLVNSHDPGDRFGVGRNEVTYIAYSSQGNDTCSFIVNVVDVQFPIIENCPTDTILFADPATCSGVVNWSPVTISDNCGIFSLVETHQPDYEFPLGDLDVLIIAADSSGNSSVCTFKVTVVDTVKPYFDDCPGTVEVLVDGTVISDPESAILFSETDNCNAARLFYAPPFGRDSCGFSSTNQIDMTGLSSGSSFSIGTHNLIYEAIDNAGNQAICDIEIIVHPLPTLSAEANGGNLICAGEDVEIKVFEPGMGYTYNWSGPNTFASTQSVDTIFNADVNDSGTYMHTATSPGGCPVSTDLIVQVNPQPDIEISHNDILCADGSSDLNLSVIDNANANVDTWQWSGPQMFNSAMQNPTVTNAGANEAGIYAVTGTTAAGCSDTDQVDVQISTAPMVPTLMVTDGDFELCVGESTTVTGTMFSGANAMSNWQVNPSSGFTFGGSSNVRVYTFTDPGIYTISYFGTVDGCNSDMATATIRVTAAPTINLTTNAPFLCSDGTQTLELNETIGGADEYIWTGPDAFNVMGQNQMIPNITRDNAGFYILTAVSGDGCTSRDSIEVEISLGPDPMMPGIEPVDSTICLGESLELFGQPYTHPNGVTYSWFQRLAVSGNLLNISNDRTVTVQPSFAGDFEYLYLATVGGCVTDTAIVSITVVEGPTASAEYNDPLVCITENMNLELSETSGGALSWSWTGPQGFMSNNQNPIVENITGNNAGTYQVTVTNRDGCSSTDSVQVMITEGLAPLTIIANDDTFCEDMDTLILMTDMIPNATYTWTGPVTINSNRNRVVIPFPTAENTGAYSVQVITDEGCTGESGEAISIEVLTAPTSVMDYVLVSFEMGIEIDVLGNDTFSSQNPITVNAITQPTKGTLEGRKDGTFRYTPDENQLDEDFVIYELCYDECPMLCSEAVITFDIQHDPNQCVIPTVITPNNDGRNDMLVVSCVEAGTFPNNEIVIFNEWGDEVYKAAPYNNDWDGTYNGKPLPDGTYYFLFFRNSGAQPQKGFVTLFR